GWVRQQTRRTKKAAWDAKGLLGSPGLLSHQSPISMMLALPTVLPSTCVRPQTLHNHPHCQYHLVGSMPPDGAHPPTYTTLTRRPVIVAGGASGIGEAIVVRFAQAGARVGFIDVQDAPATALVGRLAAQG